MIKQCDIFNSDTLNSYEKHELEKERKQKNLKEIFGKNLHYVDDKKKVVKEILERDFIRTNDDVFQVKHKMRNYYVSTSIITNKEVWVEDVSVKKVSSDFLGILKEKDRILVTNDNGILIEGIIIGFIVKKKSMQKVVIEDVIDKEVLVFDYTQIKRVIQLKREKEFMQNDK